MTDFKDFDKLVVKEGEVVFVRPRYQLSSSQAREVQRYVEFISNRTGIKVAVIPYDFDIGVVADEQAPTP